MIGVRTSLAGHRAAIAELPASARPTGELDGSIVVVDGAPGWLGRAVAAVRAGAAGLVVADPDVIDPFGADLPGADPLGADLPGDGADEVPDSVWAALRGVPIALDRELLRTDVAADAAREGAASVLTASCAAPSAAFDRTVCDAAGWLRVLAGGRLRVTAVRGRGSGAMLAAEGGGCPAGLMARVLVEGAAVPRLRVTAIGERRTEVSAAAAAPASVRSEDERGMLLAPTRFEGRERLALRRAIAAVTEGSPLTDLEDFAADRAIALAVRRARTS